MSRAPTKEDKRYIIKKGWMPPRMKSLVTDGVSYYYDTFGERCPKFKCEIFTQQVKYNLTWAVVEERKIKIAHFISYPMKPLLLINLLLSYPEIPRYVFMATFIEEMIHLRLGFEMEKPHGIEFMDLMDRCQEYTTARRWKRENLRVAIEINNQEHRVHQGLQREF